MTNASPTKLRSGNWGARVAGTVCTGEQIRITTRAGKSWAAVVDKIVWTGNGVSIVATSSTDTAGATTQPRTRREWTGCPCGSLEDFPRSSDCWTCRHDA